jgi:hypothetical protein
MQKWSWTPRLELHRCAWRKHEADSRAAAIFDERERDAASM